MLRLASARLVAGFAVLFALSHSRLLAQPENCPRPAALIAPDNPAYNDAMDLQKTLEARGFVVDCIFPTKFSSAFLVWENGVPRSTVEGEACFRTNFGDLDIVFIPKPQTFVELKIEERREGGGYLYTFSGMPEVWLVKRVGSGPRREYFLKHDNYILSVTDEKLRARLEETLHVEWQAPDIRHHR